MFLALKELKYSKAKFALIISVIILISYLVYFLTALAYGLASSYTNAVNKWDANELIITVDSNDSAMMSFMDDNDFNNLNILGDKAKLGLFPAVVSNPNLDNTIDSRLNTYLFGIENDSFIKPNEHKNLTLIDNKVIVDEELMKQGYQIGDLINVAGSYINLEIIGFSKKTTYQTAPVIYLNLDLWQEIRYATDTPPNLYSGIVVKGESYNLDNNLLSYTINDYIKTLPGYTAQVLTFTIMIVFLIIIVAFVLGIFIYVLTIQKTSMFGVMKAQGISNFYIGSSVVLQTYILVAIGIIIGLVLTVLTILFLSDIVPLAINSIFYLIITISFFLFASLGALFSVKAVLKIDPLTAIGG
ncbi:MAG TPA: ABC transporter permease [Acholeplasmataceae bacterium]|nr:ABC transporter permease [Acholeplasmataceae bacterium]